MVSAGLTPRSIAPATIQADVDIPTHTIHATESARIDGNAWRDTIVLMRLPSQEGSDNSSTHSSRNMAKDDIEFGEHGIGVDRKDSV